MTNEANFGLTTAGLRAKQQAERYGTAECAGTASRIAQAGAHKSGMARARPEPDHEYRPIKRFTPGNGRMVNWADRNEPASMRHDRVYAPIAEARSAVDAAHARCQELQRRNDALIVRRREASERGDRMQSRRLAPEHRHIVSELRRAAHDWNLAVNRLLDAELDERGY